MLRPIIWAIIVATASIVTVRAYKDDVVQMALAEHAESAARMWRSAFIDTVPDTAALFAGQPLTPEQREALEASTAGTGIFRFELVDSQSGLVLLTDQLMPDGSTPDALDTAALQAAQNGSSEIRFRDGRAASFRPDWYVEAYVPIIDAQGTILGVGEVYVDVTGLDRALRDQFNWLSFALIAIAAVVYLVPTFLFILRTEQLRRRDKELIRLSMRDPLTGLQNRAAFKQHMADLFHERRSKPAQIGLLYIDLDKFKEVNDSLGHEVGDQLLAHVAGILQSACRKDDFLARLGGDEFIIVCRGIDAGDLRDMGERILDQAFRPMRVGTNEIYPSFSIGAHLSMPSESESIALSRADLAVYKAKADGRSRVVMFTHDLEEHEARRRAVAEYLHHGVAENLLFLEFQPIFTRSSDVAGFEALLRLNGPDGAPIPPTEFIPVAEDIGLIEELGRWVLREAVSAARDWPDDCFISVNVSPHEFRRGNLPEYLLDVLSGTGVQANRVYLEITESTLLDPDMSVEGQLGALQEVGINVALDDFGTGYSSLGYLWKYRFDRLKIDKSFMEGLEADLGRYAHIIETITVLGRQLGTDIVVEGVETQAQYDTAALAGCDLFQGYMLSKPVEFAETQSVLGQRSKQA